MEHLNLPTVKKLITTCNDNSIWQYYSDGYELDNYQLLSKEPFIILSNNREYYFTSNENYDIPEKYSYVLLTTKIPTNKDLIAGNIKFKRWLKHPEFLNITSEEVTLSWKDKFKFIQEDQANDIKGLRTPQMGALYSILAHLQNPEDRGIVVMPTGTGKTETMLATLVVNRCTKLLVSVPSDSLRTQLTEKFLTLGVLKEYGIADKECYNPIVGTLNSKITDIVELESFVSKVNVVVTTMDILTDSTSEAKDLYSGMFSHFFVDEAHHSEAKTWKQLIDKFDNKKVFLFTATPFRNDGKNLQGKFIYNFSLRKAQEQKYYKEINYLPIREYHKQTADQKIAEKAVQQLREDDAHGFRHIIMARCVNKNRAKEVYEYYKTYKDLNPIIVYTNISGLQKRVEDIKNRKHRIIVCVNMLGEGFDLPELKIAAIHDERQSLPITLQFIGRFTRTSYNLLGKASFITNIAYPPIHNELEELYAKDADWNVILPRLNESTTQKEINFKNYLAEFGNLDDSKIPFQNIKPAMSTVVFRNSTNTWNPDKWKEGISDIDNYEYPFSKKTSNTLVLILGKTSKVEWGNFETVHNVEWDIIVIFWDMTPNYNRIYVNTSLKNFKADNLVNSIFGNENSMITGMNVFRVFNDVKRLSLYNVGARKGGDISYQQYIGPNVQDGIKYIEQGTMIKNNVFGVGFREGEKLSLGCSVKGKIWSYMRGNLSELADWCKGIGKLVEDESIDTNTVLKNTLKIETKFERPRKYPVLVDWHYEMYEYAENRYQISIDNSHYDLSECELNFVNTNLDENIQFSLDTPNSKIVFELELGSNLIDGVKMAYYKVNKISNIRGLISYGNKDPQNIEIFFQTFTPTIWFADGSQLFQNNYIELREQIDGIPLENIRTDSWNGVSIKKESQDIYPYIQDSIQYYFINKIKDDFEFIYDDDGSGEIADIVAINDFESYIDVHLFHLKYAKNGKIGNDIDNFYQVTGQAQKSLNWKNRKGNIFFDHLFRRREKKLNGLTCDRIIKGTEQQLESIFEAFRWTKELKFHIYIVQPSLSKANASPDILRLLGCTHNYLHTVGNVELIVYASE